MKVQYLCRYSLVVVFTDEELELIREEAFKHFANGKPVYQQSAAYFLMLNTGLRAGELCGMPAPSLKPKKASKTRT